MKNRNRYIKFFKSILLILIIIAIGAPDLYFHHNCKMACCNTVAEQGNSCSKNLSEEHSCCCQGHLNIHIKKEIAPSTAPYFFINIETLSETSFVSFESVDNSIPETISNPNHILSIPLRI